MKKSLQFDENDKLLFVKITFRNIIWARVIRDEFYLEKHLDSSTFKIFKKLNS